MNVFSQIVKKYPPNYKRSAVMALLFLAQKQVQAITNFFRLRARPNANQSEQKQKPGLQRARLTFAAGEEDAYVRGAFADVRGSGSAKRCPSSARQAGSPSLP